MLLSRIFRQSKSCNVLKAASYLANGSITGFGSVGNIGFNECSARRIQESMKSSSVLSSGWSCEAGYHSEEMHGTTVLCVRKENKVVVMADGQVTLGSQIIKPNVKKLRRLGESGNVIAGFAGATADALTLFDRLETKIEEHPGQLLRASVELSKLWRTDKYLRKLDAIMVVADSLTSLTLTGNGDVIESQDGLIGIGSGGPYALSAAKALIDIQGLDAEAIARKAMIIAADTCIYTNHNFTIESIEYTPESTDSLETELL